MLCMAEVIGVLHRSEDLSQRHFVEDCRALQAEQDTDGNACAIGNAVAMCMLLAAISVPVKTKSAASTVVVESSSAQYKLFSMQQRLLTILDAISAE